MISQVITNERVTVITPNGTQTNKRRPIYKIQEGVKKQLKAEVKVTSTIQILCGVMLFCLGAMLASVPTSPYFTPVFSVLLKSGYPFLGALCFVLAGSLSIIMEKNKTKPLVHSSLAVSILSILLAVVGIVILSFNLASVGPSTKQCELSKEKTTPSFLYHVYHEPDDRDCYTAQIALTGILSVILIITVLELGLAVLTVLMWWKQAHSDFPGSVIFKSQNSKNKSSISSKSLYNPGYEELVTA